MNNHDRKRLSSVVRTLERAKEDIGTALLYLTAADKKDPVEVSDIVDVEAHICIALDRLGKRVNST